MSAREFPAKFPSPFSSTPHAVATRAAHRLQEELTTEPVWRQYEFEREGNGKMFGVLVATDSSGTVHELRAVSGMLGQRWHVSGLVPPLFDVEERRRFWPDGQRALDELGEEITNRRSAPSTTQARDDLEAHIHEHKNAMERLQALHRRNKAHRHTLRQNTSLSPEEAHALNQQSRRDRAERQRLRERHEHIEGEAKERVRQIDEQISELKQAQTNLSTSLLRRLHDGYRLQSPRGEIRPLASFFSSGDPPGGTGDCAGVKLLGYANTHSLRPIALAEFWWGAPPSSGGRRHGFFYASCQGKCAPILPFLLDGIPVEDPPLYGANSIPAHEPTVVYEDDYLVVVNKPAGLLSVPGRSPLLQDSVQTRIRERYPATSGPFLAHRLDLDTSGLLVVAKTARMHSDLQRLFARRLVKKCYVAWLLGKVATDAGTIQLPILLDYDDRPRHVVGKDGKDSITDWQVLTRTKEHTKVAFFPRTGRTHQLRVHASHPRGLNAPIVGDRLYGLPEKRLLLHALRLRFTHPMTGRTIEVVSAEPPDFAP